MRKLLASLVAALPLVAAAQGGTAQAPQAPPQAAQPAPAPQQPPAAAPQATSAPAQPAPQYYPPPPQGYPPPQGQYAPPPGQYPPPQYAPPPPSGQYPPPPPGYQAPPQGYYPPPQGYPSPPPQYQPYPPPQPMPKQRAPYQRDNWYIGFQLGGGAGSVKLKENTATGTTGEAKSLRKFLGSSPTTFAFDFQLGATVTPKLLLGGQLTGFAAAASRDTQAGKVDRSFSQTNLNALATFFPWERGFFLRGGLGLASASATFKATGVAEQKEDASGLNLTAGLGWAWWLGKSFNLSANLDVSGQSYGKSDYFKSSSLATLALGFSWY